MENITQVVQFSYPDPRHEIRVPEKFSRGTLISRARSPSMGTRCAGIEIMKELENSPADALLSCVAGARRERE